MVFAIHNNNYYELLGVERDASENEIKKAFWDLARKWHPDVNPDDPSAETRFKEINEAYQVLSDPETRSNYDMYGHEGGVAGGWAPDLGGFDSFGSIFDAFFGGQPSGRKTKKPTEPVKGPDANVAIHMTLEEAAIGITKELVFERMEVCATCGGEGMQPGTGCTTCLECMGTGQIHSANETPFGSFVRVATCLRCRGTGTVMESPCKECMGNGQIAEETHLEVAIPPGVSSASKMRIRGKGHAGLHGGEPGDLYVYIDVELHPLFQRAGKDLQVKVPVHYVRLALGGKIVVPTIDGPEITVDIPRGTQVGQAFRVQGYGMPVVSLEGVDPKRGDLFVTIGIIVPQVLSDEEQELLERLAEIQGLNFDEHDCDLNRGKNEEDCS